MNSQLLSYKDVVLGIDIPLGFLKLLISAYITWPSKLNKSYHPKKGASHNLPWDAFVRTLTNTESCKDRRQPKNTDKQSAHHWGAGWPGLASTTFWNTKAKTKEFSNSMCLWAMTPWGERGTPINMLLGGKNTRLQPSYNHILKNVLTVFLKCLVFTNDFVQHKKKLSSLGPQTVKAKRILFKPSSLNCPLQWYFSPNRRISSTVCIFFKLK